MDAQTIESTIKAYMQQIIHMSLATVGADGRPWVCELHYAVDDELNIYWMSSQTARHSQEVVSNPHVSGTIVTQHFLDQMPRAVQFEGTVEVLTAVTPDHSAYKAYVTRYLNRAAVLNSDYQSDEPAARRLYKITVSDYYLIDGITTGKIEKLHLSWKAAKA
jgi:uncharacterized protein YhbP (UPF0306 family)